MWAQGVGSMWNSVQPPQNHWAVLKTNNNSTCQKYKIWTKDKCGQWEWDPDHLSSSPSRPHLKRWTMLSYLPWGEQLTCLQVPQVLRWALWEMSGTDATHWTGNTSCLCIAEDDYRNTLLCLPHHANKSPKDCLNSIPKDWITEQACLMCAGVSDHLGKWCVMRYEICHVNQISELIG